MVALFCATVYINYIKKEGNNMTKHEKIVVAVIIIDIILIAFLMGYYYGHYMNPHNIIRYVPYCKHVKATWI